MQVFWSNLKATLKFVGIVFFALSIAIMSDAYSSEKYEDLYFPLYFLSFLPVILIGVLTYTKLKITHINKYLCCMIFGAVITVSIFALYIIGHFLDSTELEFRFIRVMSIIAFVTTSLIYLQLPYKKDT